MKNARFLAAFDLRAGALRYAVATLLVTILVLQTSLAASGPLVPKSAAAEQSAQAAALRQKVLKVKPQSMVVVKLKNKEQLRGRLAQVTDEIFTVKVRQGQDLVDRQLVYSDVKFLKAEDSYSRANKWVVVGLIIAATVVGLVILAVARSD